MRVDTPVQEPYRAAGATWRATTPWLFAALVVVGTLVSRLPFVAQSTAADHDAAHFILALDHFDLVHKQPHPPGYLLFLAPAALAYHMGLAPLTALIWASIAFSTIGVLLTWRLGCALFGPQPGLAGALLLLCSPLFWSRGELGLSYTAEAACQALLGWALWTATAAPGGALVRAGAALGVAAGIRQDVLLFVAPLGVWVAGHARRGVAARAAAAVVGSALLWGVPLLILSGGPGEYVYASHIQADSMAQSTGLASPSNVRANARVVATGLAWLGGAGWLIPLVWLFVRAAGSGVRFDRFDRRTVFLVVWTVPPMLFFVVVFAKLDYVLTLAPAVVVVLGAALVTAVPHQKRRAAVLSLLVAANTALFLLWPAGSDEALGHRDIVAADALVAAYHSEVTAHYSPRDVAILIPADSAFDFRTAMVELPSYAVFAIDFDQLTRPAYIQAEGYASTYPLPTGGALVSVAANVGTLVWLSEEPPDPSWGLLTDMRTTPDSVRYFVFPFASDQDSLNLGQYRLVRSAA